MHSTFKKFLLLATPTWKLIAYALVGVAVYSLATLAIAAEFSALVETAEVSFASSTRLFLLFGAAFVSNYLRLKFIGIAGETIIADMRHKLFRALVRLPLSYFDAEANRTAGLVHILSADCNLVGVALTEAVMQGSKNLVQTLGSIAMMLYVGPVTTSLIIAAIPPVVVFTVVYGKRVRKLQKRMTSKMAVAATVAEERLTNIRTVRAFGKEGEATSCYDTRVQDVLEVSKEMLVTNAGFSASVQLAGYIALYITLWGTFTINGTLTPATLFSYTVYAVYCGIGLMGLTKLATELNKGYSASIRIFEVLDREEKLEQEEARQNQVAPASCNWNIRLDGVVFAYPSRPEVRVYDNLSLEIKPSQCTCIVGSSGSGKSTLAMLLLKLYTADSGKFLIGEDDLSSISASWIRSKVGYVGQEPVLFGGTIAQNIAYGLAERKWDDPIDRWTMNAITDAASRANAHDFIQSLPQGYETYVGESGRALSGGQKQRIAIARALVRNPNVLILDEATSALDSESEGVVHDAIEKLISSSKGDSQRSVLMFAHKLSMIRQADLIIVFDEGKVVTQGNFEQVSANRQFRSVVGLARKS